MSDDRPPTRGVPRMRGYGYVDPTAIGIPTIEVYCDRLHDEKPDYIPVFGKVDGAWAILPPHMQVRGLRARDDLLAFIDRATGARVSAPTETDVYLRYNLRCDECGLSVPAHAKHLQSIFDTLFAAGMPSIRLAALSARLRSGMPR